MQTTPRMTRALFNIGKKGSADFKLRDSLAVVGRLTVWLVGIGAQFAA
jgi:hypothetical protein